MGGGDSDSAQPPPPPPLWKWCIESPPSPPDEPLSPECPSTLLGRIGPEPSTPQVAVLAHATGPGIDVVTPILRPKQPRLRKPAIATFTPAHINRLA